jgi:hypothetical protein
MATANTDNKVKKLVTVFADRLLHARQIRNRLYRDLFVTPQAFYTGTNIEPQKTVYRDTRKAQLALYLNCKNTRRASLITTSKALSRRENFSFPASICSAAFS